MKGELAQALEPLILFAMALSALMLAIVGKETGTVWRDALNKGEPLPTYPIRFACVAYLAGLMLPCYGIFFAMRTLPAYLIIGAVLGLTTPLRMIVYRRVLYGKKAGFDWSLLRRPNVWLVRTIGMTCTHTLAWPISMLLAFAFFDKKTEPTRW
jgi:hypothetical protein